MDGLDRLDLFRLVAHGDRHEREFWPLLSNRFPSYELLWRRLIVPLTCRIDPKMAASPEQWIRLRPGIPDGYERTSMAHYSVFYFLGRAVKRCAEEKTVLEYPEDVLFLLDSVGDNLALFLQAMNRLGADCGSKVFNASVDQFPRGHSPWRVQPSLLKCNRAAKRCLHRERSTRILMGLAGVRAGANFCKQDRLQHT
jgi:hypothetical protein